ncbi:MAG: aromatic ring-hydroxylating dioxygenase subunit alpha [Oxalobacteraceae bacterium]|nr:MAG: aromatic ring-hydroxylating dioxygenase subunit alpha [Oxalobacteraceae bacterium]
MNGENTFVYGRSYFDEEDLDIADVALVPCRVELWGGCAFVNFDNEAPPLVDCLGPTAERMDARNVGHLRAEWWNAAVLPVNWKLALEAFMEGYHVMATHPQIHRLSTPESLRYGPDAPHHPPQPTASETGRAFVEVSIARLVKLGEGMAGMVHPSEAQIAQSLLEEDWPDEVTVASVAFMERLRSEITSQARAQGLPMPDLNQLARDYPFKPLEFFFPNYCLLPMLGAMSAYRVRPLSAETCLFEIWSLAFQPEDPDREPLPIPIPMAHDDPRFPEIPQQDYSNLPMQQLGLHATGFETMRLSPQVEGLISNFQRLIDGYLDALPSDVLMRGSALTCGGLDSPISDIGF